VTGPTVVASPLVAVTELAAALDADDPPAVLDVRWQLGGPPGIDAYREGHLPGAVFADLDRDLSAAPSPGRSGGRHPLPSTADAEAALRRLGVDDDRPVVVYDDAGGTVAARAWWLLRHLGHTDVRLLDGGYPAWTAAGLPVETGEGPVPRPGGFAARPGGMPVLDASGAAEVARDGVLLDVRAVERYRGEVEPVDPVAGHVPGAVSAPTTGNLAPDGRLLDPTRLRDRFAALGVDPAGPGPVAAYCGSGVNAAHTVLALEVAGTRAALYAGSWSDWVSDPWRPVAVGEG
jgi:thiosulfate/3-mercaptopyruvate sulfurtransferase